METRLKIEGMTCEMCVRHVTNALQSVPGVERAVVNLKLGEAVVRHEEASLEAMSAAVREEGYKASPIE
jgi:copper chaperone